MKIFYIPNGPKNLVALFPALDFANIAEYYIELLDFANETIGTGTISQLSSGACCNDKVRIHFINYLGTVDAINFNLYTDEHEAKSDTLRKTVSYPLVKTLHGANRFNVRANNIMTLSNRDYREEDMKWVNELMDSPMVWMEWAGIQGQSSEYIPLVLLDGKMQNKKLEDRYEYEVIIQAVPSHERYILRN